jgi:hypothetical protein
VSDPPTRPDPKWWTTKKFRGDVGTILSVKVPLSKPEQRVVEPHIRRVVKRYNDARSAQMKFTATTSNEHVTRHGFGAEYAVALLYRGTDPVQPVPWNKGKDDLPDICDRIGVRWTGVLEGPICVYAFDRRKQLERAFVLTQGDWPTFEILGWAWDFEIYDNGVEINEGDLLPFRDYHSYSRYQGKSWYLPRERLHPWPGPPCHFVSSGGDPHRRYR